MQSPGVKPFSMEESLQEIERQVEIAITSVKKMEKYDGIWHPDAKKGVSLPFTDAVVIALHAILGTARQIRSNIEETQAEDWISKHNSAKSKRSDFGFEWTVKKDGMEKSAEDNFKSTASATPKKETTMNNKIRIHCFETTGIEGFPSNTYEANSTHSALDCIKGILENKNSGISRILIENPSFGDSRCYNNISAMSPMGI